MATAVIPAGRKADHYEKIWLWLEDDIAYENKEDAVRNAPHMAGPPQTTLDTCVMSSFAASAG